MARSARQAGRGLTGRARVLYGLLGEVEAHLLGAVRCSSVDWLDSQALAAAVRTGFAPGDRAVLVQAAADAAAYPGTQTGVPWAVAGPGSGLNAGALVRARRVEVGVRGGAAPRPGRHPRSSGAGAGARQPGGAALLHRVLPAGLGPQGRTLLGQRGDLRRYRWGAAQTARSADPGPATPQRGSDPRRRRQAGPRPGDGAARRGRVGDGAGVVGRSTTTAGSWSRRSGAPATPRSASTWPPTPGSSPPPSPSGSV